MVPLAVIAARASTTVSPGSAGRNFFESAEALVIQKAAQLAAAARVLKLAQPTAFIRPSTARALATDGGHLPLLTNTKLTALLLQVVPLSERKMSNWSEKNFGAERPLLAKLFSGHLLIAFPKSRPSSVRVAHLQFASLFTIRITRSASLK